MDTSLGAQESSATPSSAWQERMAWAAKVRELRDARGWSQAELARRAGVARNTVASMEKSGTVPQADKLGKVLRALDAHPSQQRPWSEDVELWIHALAPMVESLEESARARVMARVVAAIGEELRRQPPTIDGGVTLHTPAE